MDPKEMSAKGDEFFMKGDYAKAEELYMQVVAGGQKFADIYNKLGLISCNKGAYEKAARYFERALELNPKYTEVSLNLSVTYNEMGLYDKAKEVQIAAQGKADKETKGMDPFVKGKLANLHFTTGEIYHEMGLLDDALTEYLKAAALRPDFVDVKVKIGIAYRDKGLTDRAITEFKEAKALNPNYTPAGINLGTTYYSMSKFDLAEKEWSDVLKRHPGNKTAEMYLRLIKKKA